MRIYSGCLAVAASAVLVFQVLQPVSAQASGSRSLAQTASASSAVHSPWIEMQNSSGKTIFVRFYSVDDSQHAELELNKHTYQMGKVGEKNGAPVYGDGESLTMVGGRNSSSVEISDARSNETYIRVDQLQQAEDGPDATDAPWIELYNKNGEKISVRYYSQGDNDYADLEMQNKTYGLSKITEDRHGNPVYGDGTNVTMISFGGGGSVEISQGDKVTRYE